MLDPFPLPNPLWLQKSVQPFADYFHLTTLPLHIHEVLGSFLGYTFINIVLAPVVSRWLFPVKYGKLSRAKKVNWDVHVVSLTQSTFINFLALWVMWTDEERKNMNQLERVFGYTGGAGMIQGLSAGYFLWDLAVTLRNVKAFGLEMLAHAVCALIVFSFGFKPFVNFYSSTFILYELSSPFLNFHWFFDKLDMTGSKAQLYNGILLMFTFFGCRLCWGNYQSVRVFQDVWAALHHTPAAASIHYDHSNNGTLNAAAAAGKSAAPINTGIMRFAGEEFVPLWLGLTYLASNIVLNALNFYWFGKMIITLKKRFEPQVEKTNEKPIATRTTGVDDKVRIDVDQTEVRRRIVDNSEISIDGGL